MSEAPRRLGGHRLLRKLGAGGMGVVYEAVQEATGARRVVKLLGGRDAESRLRFQREGQALAKVDGHPNVVRVHSLGQEGGQLFLVMDLAEGGSLADRLRSGPLAPRESAHLVRDLALGLAHVHAAGILHRDLKPDNVLFDGGGTPKLTDFGLAKVSSEGSLTATGDVIGTPAYMSPEQADGQTVDERADVYGLGAILYEVLTGAPPFAGRSVLETLHNVLQRQPPPPRSVRPEIPVALETVCLRALAKAPGKRQPSAAALAEELSSWETSAAPAVGALRALGAGAVLAILVLLTALLGWTLSREKPRAEAPGPTTVPLRPPEVAPPESRAMLSWRQVRPAEGDPWPAAREGHERAMAWIPGTGVVLFGGWDRRTAFDGLWVWNGRRWRELPRTEPWPERRYAHAMVYDAARGRLVLYGGLAPRGGSVDSTHPGTIWEWAGKRWEIQPRQGLTSRRFWHAMADDPRSEGVFLFGGIIDAPVSWGGLLRWDGRIFSPRQRADFSTPLPETRGQCGLAFDSKRQVLVLYGGQRGIEGQGYTPYRDLWEWDGSAWLESRQASRRGPGARTALGMVYALDRVVVFGGRFDDGRRPVETWGWDGSRWEELQAAKPPPGRIWHGMVYDGDRDVIVVFGGSVADRVQNDLWELDLSGLRKP